MTRPSGSTVGMSFMNAPRIDRAGEQRLLDLLGEQPLAADLRQRPVLDAVAGGLDDDDARTSSRQAVRRRQPARAPRAPAPAPGASRGCRCGASDCLQAVSVSGARRPRSRAARHYARGASQPQTLPDAVPTVGRRHAREQPCSSFSASRRAATRPPPPSSARDAGRPRAHPVERRALAVGESTAPYGGVVPEIAARAHVECLDSDHRARPWPRPASDSTISTALPRRPGPA